MKILVEGISQNIGGIETFILNYARAIKTIDPSIQFDFLVYYPTIPIEKQISELGGKIYKVPRPYHYGNRSAVKKIFKNNKYDIVWSNKVDLYHVEVLDAAKKAGVKKIILHSHNSSNMWQGIKGIRHQILHCYNKKRVSEIASDFWTCSDEASQWLFDQRLLKENKIVLINNAIDTEMYKYNQKIRDEKRLELGISNSMVIGLVGRLQYQKNPKFALEIFDEYYKKNHNSSFLVVGTGELQDDLKKYASLLDSKERIQFLGVRSDVPELMQAMDVLLLPSRFEGLPMVSVEAQASGLPVYASSEGVTQQANIANLIRYLPLEKGSEFWASEIYNTSFDNTKRKDAYKIIQEKGFDLFQNAKRIYSILMG